MIKKALLCSIGFLLAGCSSNSSMDNYSSDYSSRPNRKTSNKIGGEQAVVDYLVSHWSSEYNFVSTGDNTLLGYNDGDFFLR